MVLLLMWVLPSPQRSCRAGGSSQACSVVLFPLQDGQGWACTCCDARPFDSPRTTCTSQGEQRSFGNQLGYAVATCQQICIMPRVQGSAGPKPLHAGAALVTEVAVSLCGIVSFCCCTLKLLLLPAGTDLPRLCSLHAGCLEIVLSTLV